MAPCKFIDPVTDGVSILILLFTKRASSFGFIISIIFVFCSSIDVAGAKISFSTLSIDLFIEVGKRN